MAGKKKGHGRANPHPLASQINKNRSKGNGGSGGAKSPKRPKVKAAPPIDPLAPQSYGQIQQAASQAGQVAYGPQQQQLQQQAQNIQPWFEQYKQGVLAQQRALPAQYAPIQQQAQQTAQATGQGVLQGVDPNSEAAHNDALAAASRKALADTFVNLIGAQQGATQDYYGGRQGVANAAQISAQTQNAQNQQNVAGQRGAYEQQQIQQGIGAERDYGLATQHQAVENAAFHVGVQKDRADVKTDRLKIKATAKAQQQKQKAAGKTVNKYGYTNEQWARFSPSHRQRIIHNDRVDSRAPKTPGTEKKPYTPEQHHNAKVDLRKAVSLIKAELGPNTGNDTTAGPSPSSSEFWNKAYQALINNKDMDPAIARAAIQIVRHGRVKPPVAKILAEDYGILHPPKGKRTKQPEPTIIQGVHKTPGNNGQMRPG